MNKKYLRAANEVLSDAAGANDAEYEARGGA